MKALVKHGGFEVMLVHTGQHYDDAMSRRFFSELDIPEPDINLETGLVTQAESSESTCNSVQRAEIMIGFEPVVLDFKPDYVMVVGDVNSTLACGLVAKDLGVDLIHIEAGQRSYDRSMPEEINRIVTDVISDMLFVSEPSGVENLRREGIDPKKIHFTGNVMIDTLLNNIERAGESRILDRLELTPESYCVVTLHRPSNVDDEKTCTEIINALDVIQAEQKLMFPVHPRTLKNLGRMNLLSRIRHMENMIVSEPLGYLDFLRLMSMSAMVITDSGGIQEETAILGIPCMTLRETTEWPETIDGGTNHLVRPVTDDIVQSYHEIMEKGTGRKCIAPELWDGKASERIVDIIFDAAKTAVFRE